MTQIISNYTEEENRGLRIIRRTLRGLGFLLVALYEILIGQSEMLKKWNKQEPSISMQIISTCCLFHCFALKNSCSWLQTDIPIHIGSYTPG